MNLPDVSMWSDDRLKDLAEEILSKNSMGNWPEYSKFIKESRILCRELELPELGLSNLILEGLILKECARRFINA